MSLPHIIGGEIKSQELNDNFAYLDDRLKYAKAPVDEYEHLPTEGNEEGDYRIVRYGDQSGIYFWDGSQWNLLQQSAESIRFISDITDAETVQAMLRFMEGVQIIDDNLHQTSPPNGWYVKWVNGLAVCWRRDEDEFPGFDDYNGSNLVPYPISFKSGMVAGGGIITSTYRTTRERLMDVTPSVYAGNSNWYVFFHNHDDLPPEQINRRHYWAIGIAE